jgi:hypothetical protein
LVQQFSLQFLISKGNEVLSQKSVCDLRLCLYL